MTGCSSAIESKRSHVVVGLDPEYGSLPPEVLSAHPQDRYRGRDGDEGRPATATSCRSCCPRSSTRRAAVKIQIAYFEALGARGYALYEEMVRLAKSLGYVVIADVKRGDIGSTAEAYARAHLDVAGADAVTVNPYFGSDGLEPFFRRCREAGKGVFVLVKTSNPSSAEIQDVALESGRAASTPGWPTWWTSGAGTRSEREATGRSGPSSAGRIPSRAPACASG